MKTIGQLLQNKGATVIAVAPHDSVFSALTLMAQHNTGSVLVLEDGKLLGIFSERDYARKVALQGKASRDMPVREVMTEKVCYVSPSITVDESMALMTDKHVRHLPVLDAEARVIGIVSIGDLVKETLSQQKFIIEQLEAYILR